MSALRRWVGWGAATAMAGVSVVQAQEQKDAQTTAPRAPAEALAESCLADRYVVLTPASEFNPALAAEVRTDLAAELEQRGLSVCSTDAGEGRAAAHIDLRAHDLLVVIELDDRVTHKRVARDLSLAGIPENGRALAIAIAIDELLRASWAELTLAREPRAGTPEPRSDQRSPGLRVLETTETINARGREPAAPLRIHAAADLGYAHTARSFDAFSLNARASLRPWGRGWLELSVGGLASVPARGEYGDVLATGFRSALTFGACAYSRGPTRLFGCGGARGEVDWLAFRGIRANMASGRREADALIHTSLAGLLAVTIASELYLFGELALGTLVKGARATEGARTLMGVTGLLLSLHVGLGIEL